MGRLTQIGPAHSDKLVANSANPHFRLATQTATHTHTCFKCHSADRITMSYCRAASTAERPQATGEMRARSQTRQTNKMRSALLCTRAQIACTRKCAAQHCARCTHLCVRVAAHKSRGPNNDAYSDDDARRVIANTCAQLVCGRFGGGGGGARVLSLQTRVSDRACSV